MLDLVENPEDRFSHNEAHLIDIFTESLAVTFLLYNNLEELMNPVSESDSPVAVTKVISASVKRHEYAVTPVLSHDQVQLERPMNFTLYHNQVSQKSKEDAHTGQFCYLKLNCLKNTTVVDVIFYS